MKGNKRHTPGVQNMKKISVLLTTTIKKEDKYITNVCLPTIILRRRETSSLRGDVRGKNSDRNSLLLIDSGEYTLSTTPHHASQRRVRDLYKQRKVPKGLVQIHKKRRN